MLFAVAFLFCSVSLHAQLPDFTLNAIPANETCPGNGSLQMSVTGTDPAATVTYVVYLLPDTVTPIANSTADFISGLGHGTYHIVATQTLAPNAPNSHTIDVTIIDEFIPVDYGFTTSPVTCGSNGTITVNVLTGNPVSYEITSGPVIVPLQPSNVFTGLPAGVYQIRVYDNCGEGVVKTCTLLSSTGGTLNWTESDEATVIDCNQITITNTLSPTLNASLSFPLTVTYTVHPPAGGAPIVTVTHMAGGDVSGQEFVTVIPYYSNLVYTYDVTVTDACGNGYYFTSIAINKPFLVDLRTPPAPCGHYFIAFAVSNYMPPVTVNFTDYPAGFDPATFNLQHPGPFASELINYGGTTNPVPYGQYAATLTDGCGRSVSVSADIEYIDPIPAITATADPGCAGTGEVKIKVTNYTLDTAFITSGPVAYSATYPVDISSLINGDQGITLDHIPSGHYTIHMTDTCGNIYDDEFDIPGAATQVSAITWPDCDLNRGAIRIRGNLVDLQSVIITSAPAAYGTALPQNVSFNINATTPDVFSMNGFPDGDYVFDIVDSCGMSHTVPVNPSTYEITEDSYNLIPHCGSFDLELTHVTNAINPMYFLQKFNPVTSGWEHPETGFPFNTGDIPNTTNSLLFLPNTINYNIPYLGDFRIVKVFDTFENGSIDLYKKCFEILHEFTFVNELEITDIKKVTCNGLNSDVYITAVGFPPLTYKITTKNGQPFDVDNGNNNVFTNLEAAVYNFLVFDTCGNVANRLADVALLPSLVNIVDAQNVPDFIECDEEDNDGQANFHLPDMNAVILGAALPASFTITYHASLSDANSGLNPLPEDYYTASTTIFCRVAYANAANCFDITSFDVVVNPFPFLQMETNWVICEGENITITADSGLDSYLWSTGETTPEIVVSQPGTYTLEVTRTTNNVTCTATYTIVVVASNTATIGHIDTVDWTWDQNTITVVIDQSSLGNYVYSLDGVNFQPGNTFYGLSPGTYTVYVKDMYGCDTVSQIVHLLGYPRFFTPNGDGYHDYWQIINATVEPNMKIYIFDRYGKLLTGFGSDSPGWDGRYNQHDMPSTDYWFLVIRENGDEKRGHFAMKR